MLVFLSVLALVYFFVVERLITEIKNKNNEFQKLVAIQEKQRRRLNELPKIRRDIEALEVADEKIHNFLKKDNAVELIQEVEKLAESTENSITIEVAAPEAPNKTKTKDNAETIISRLPSKDYIQLKIKITGSFLGLLKFMNKLENSNYYLDIVSLQVSRNQDQEATKSAQAVAKNPFNQSSSGNDGNSGIQKDDAQEVVSLISVVVYTQN